MTLRLLIALAALLAAPDSARAATSLVGGPTGEPMHLLTADLKPVAGGPRLPRATFATVLSPSGARFAALTPSTIVFYDRRTGRRQGAVPSRGTVRMLWPARFRLVTLGYDPSGREVLRSIDLRRRRVARRVRLDERLDLALAGHRVRILLRSPEGLRVDEFGAGGRLRRSFPVPLPPDIDPGFSNASMRGDLVMVSYTTGAVAPYAHALVRLGGGAEPVALAGAVYSFVTPDLLVEAGGHLARIDRAAATVVREIEIDAAQWVEPFGGGVVVGLGRALYDGSLDLVADNPHAARAAAAPVVRGRRLYARTIRCPNVGPVRGVVVADARTGRILIRRNGPFAIGRIGGEVSVPGEDGCD